MITIDILFIVLISFLTWFTLKRSFLFGFLVLVLTTPLAHKEDFSLIIWDFLPARVVFLNILAYNVFSLVNAVRKLGVNRFITAVKTFILLDFISIGLILLLVSRGISILFVSDPIYSLKLYAFYLSIVVLYLNVRFLYITYKLEFVKASVKAFLYIGIFTALFAGIQFYLRYFFKFTIGAAWVIPGFTPRLGSTFWDVNHYGGFLNLVIPLSISQIFIHKKPIYKLAYTLLSLLLCLAMLSTQSRSAWIGLGVGFIIYAIILWLNGYKRFVLSVVVLSVIATFSYVGIMEYKRESVFTKAKDFMHHRLDSTDTHVYLLEGAAQVFFNNMVFGAGYGNFNTGFRTTKVSTDYFAREPRLKETRVPPHSVWGEVVAENGGFGSLLYFSIIVFITLSVLTAIFVSKENYQKHLGIGLVSVLFAIYTTGIFYSYNLEFYWLAIFISAGYAYSILNQNFNPAYLINWWQSNKVTPYLLILPFAIFVLYINLGKNALIDWDEAIYAKVAKNMVLTGDYISLHWDSLKDYWFEKPPLYMWLTALTFQITGFNSFGARFFAATFGLLTVLIVYLFAKTLFNKFTGVLAALILASTLKYIFYARNGMLDVPVSFFITASVYVFYLAYIKYLTSKSLNKSHVKLLIVTGVLVGLGVMTKAVVGLLPLAIIGIFTLYNVALKRISVKSFLYINLILLCVTLLVAAPWHIYEYWVHGYKFFKTYFISHMVNRGLEGKGHTAPGYYYFDVIKVSYRIWVLPLLFTPVLLARLYIKKSGLFASIYNRLESRMQEVMLILSSITVIFLFFSLSKDKLFWYIIPIFPFLAIISARVSERLLFTLDIVIESRFRPSRTIIKFLGLSLFLLIAIFYTAARRDLAYTNDVNKDKVALIKINNGLFDIEDYPNRTLYYNNMDPPVVMFYSDHAVSHASKDKIIDLIENAGPNESLSFLTPDNVYYDVRNTPSTPLDPIVVNVRGSAGRWTLFVSQSRIELLVGDLRAVDLQIEKLINTKLSRPLTNIEIDIYNKYQSKRVELVDKLTGYGYVFPTKINKSYK